MKKLICLIVVCMSAVLAYGQQEDTVDYNSEVKHVQIEPAFPGGMTAWNRFLERNLDYKLVKKCSFADSLTEQTIVVSFLVDKQGSVSDVIAVNADEVCTALATASINLVKKGPRWVPAQLNGRAVIYRHTVKINWPVKK